MDKAPLLSAKRVDYRSRLRSRVSKVQAGARRIVQTFVPSGSLLFSAAYAIAICGVFFLAFLGLFVLHQLFLWISIRPAYAFDRAKEVVWVLEVVWDSFANIGNALLGAVDTLIPLWNSGSTHCGATVYILLDVFSLFLRGMRRVDTEPRCRMRFRLQGGESQSLRQLHTTRLQDADASGSTFVENSIVLGAATSRRLSELTGEVIVPVLDLSEMTNGLTLLSSSLITMLGSLGDTLMHVLYTVLSEVAVFILDLLVIILKELMKVIMMIVQSGVLEDIINVAVDILTIFIIKVAIPLIMAAIDLLMCALDLFNVGGYDAQLQCIDARCFESESDALSDLIVFTSAPIVWDTV